MATRTATHTGWTTDDMGDLTGRTAVVTGANSGLGLATTLALAAHGAHVVMACRSEERATAAMVTVRERVPDASLAFVPLDLADLSSVRDAASHVVDSTGRAEGAGRIDLLINNAGVMALPKRQTADGFEMQFGTNHLGHFAFTGLVLDAVRATPGSRVVTVASNAHKIGRIDFDDLMGARRYRKWKAYGQAKLANLLFAYELQHRLAASGADTISVAAHPGYANTELQLRGPQMQGSSFTERVMDWANGRVAQSAEMGALPTLYAATADDVHGGDYVGPDGWLEQKGHPVKVPSNARSHDTGVARRLWSVSEELTGVRYRF
jgi:NAD(P)-dependent dehydrogenase (short-subunit alcohol dehydrogenase family)